MLEELNIGVTEISEEQHHRLEEVTPLTSESETSEAENYSGARPKTTSRAKLTSVIPCTLPQEAVASMYNCYLGLSWEQPLKVCATPLRDEVFNVIPGTINTQHGTASLTRKVKSGSDYK